MNLGMTKAEVLSFREGLKTALTSGGGQGGAVVEWSANGTTVKRQFQLSEMQLAEEARFALEQLCPEDYPAVPNRAGARFV